MKVYIAGKITGNDNYKKQFTIVERKLKNLGHYVMNPAVLGTGFEHDEYMSICYKMIDVCDIVYMLSNWKDSKGAKMEHNYAKNKQKFIHLED